VSSLRPMTGAECVTTPSVPEDGDTSASSRRLSGGRSDIVGWEGAQQQTGEQQRKTHDIRLRSLNPGRVYRLAGLRSNRRGQQDIQRLTRHGHVHRLDGGLQTSSREELPVEGSANQVEQNRDEYVPTSQRQPHRRGKDHRKAEHDVTSDDAASCARSLAYHRSRVFQGDC
jgi:hypothetical protein